MPHATGFGTGLAPRTLRGLLTLGLALGLAGTLAACDSLAGPDVVPSGTPTSTAESPSADPRYSPATTCTSLVGTALENELLADGLVLFTGPDGTGIYPELPSTAQGGGTPLYCIYGQDGVDLSTVEFAAQAVTEQEHEGILTALTDQGFTVKEKKGIVTFTQQGAEGTEPAIEHRLHADGWVSVYSSFGGITRFAEIDGWTAALESLRWPVG